MTELPIWVAPVVEALTYVFFGPLLVLYAVFGAGIMVVAIAYPIWVAFRGRDADGSVPPFVRIVIGLVGLGLLWQMIAPWL